MATLTLGGSLQVNGQIAGSSYSIPADQINRSSIIQRALVVYPVPLTFMRVWDAVVTALVAAAANDDMGLVTGTFGTDIPSLQGVDFGATTSDEKCRFFFGLPAEYEAGQTAQVRLSAGMLTTISDTSCTADVEVFKSNRDGVDVGGDLCATAAQSINSLTAANFDFDITATSLSPGDLLDIRLSFAGADTGNAGVMIPVIYQVEMRLDIRG